MTQARGLQAPVHDRHSRVGGPRTAARDPRPGMTENQTENQAEDQA